MKRVIDNLYTLKGAKSGTRVDELRTLLGLAPLGETSTEFVEHSLATAANDFLVASGSGVYVKKTLAETKVILLAGGLSLVSSVTTAISVGTGTFTTGLSLGGTLTTGISIGACTTGITIGNVPTCIVNTDVGATGEHFLDMVDAYAGMVIETGTYASTANKGVKLVAANNRPVSFLFDDGGAALVGADYRSVLARTLLTIDQSNGITLNSFRGHLKALDGIDVTSANAVISPISAYLELEGTGARTLTGHVAGFRAALEEGASGTTTVAASSYYAGIEITLNSSRSYTLTGSMAALLINTSGGTAVWSNGIMIPNSMVTTGINIGTCTTGILIGGTTTTAISVTGSATDAFKIATGTFTTGINLGGTLTTGVTVGACTTAYAVAGNATDGFKIVSGTITTGFNVGSAVTTGFAVNAATTTAFNVAGNATDAYKVTSGAITNGVNIAGAVTTGILVGGATTTGVSVTGSATDALKVSVGTFTNGLNLGGTLTTAITIGACTTGVSFGNIPTAISITDVGVAGEHIIDMVNAYTGMLVETGTYASTASNGITLSATNQRPVSLLFDDGGVLLGAGNYRSVLSRTYIAETQSGQIALRSMRGHVKLASTKNLDIGANEFGAVNGVEGYIELAGTHTIGANTRVAALHGYVEVTDDVTLTAGGYLAGVFAELGQVTAKTVSGLGTVGFLVDRLDSDHSTHQAAWGYGIKITDSASVTGVSIGTSTTGLDFAGTHTTAINIAAAANVTNLFKFNAAAGCILNVDVNPKDVPSGGGLGADACIRVDIAGQDYFIPLFTTELS